MRVTPELHEGRCWRRDRQVAFWGGVEAGALEMETGHAKAMQPRSTDRGCGGWDFSEPVRSRADLRGGQPLEGLTMVEFTGAAGTSFAGATAGDGEVFDRSAAGAAGAGAVLTGGG